MRQPVRHFLTDSHNVKKNTMDQTECKEKINKLHVSTPSFCRVFREFFTSGSTLPHPATLRNPVTGSSFHSELVPSLPR